MILSKRSFGDNIYTSKIKIELFIYLLTLFNVDYKILAAYAL